MRSYDHKEIEAKWRKRWEREKLYRVPEDSAKEKCYVLDMFPYPSGAGLHVGHPKGYIATDVYARHKRMQGYNVLHPMGWDAFGLPAENYALKNKIHPKIAVDQNVARFKEQLEKIGFDYDWDREVNTTDPSYYKWTQWIFVQLFKKGLAYESYEPINWCPSCKTGLANEDLDGDRCERCDSVIEKKPMRQWVLKITDYADRLLKDLETLPWPEYVKEAQRNWIGRSEGALLEFKVKDHEFGIRVFTTRPDTLYGATYVVLAPEHELVKKLLASESFGITNREEVLAYIEKAGAKSEIDRTAADKEKTGVRLEGVTAINPANEEELPIYIADYVLAGYGTGAIMAVPAHDERDFAFAKRYGLPIRCVVESPTPDDHQALAEPCRTSSGTLIGSGLFTGMDSEEAKAKITEHAGGKLTTQYRLQDWVFSRQRYWGEPIPIIHCEKCGAVPVSEKDLPVKLPDVESYELSGTGESPLANIEEWVNTVCPSCGGNAKRETNTMPQWAGSCWYYLRYLDPHNDTALVDPAKERYWSPVDVYVGGMEHATRHLIYARFWHKFLFDVGVAHDQEPFRKLHTVGLIMAEDGRKMSKRWGNIVNPDDMIERMGADALRVYEMFMGPFGQSIAWSTDHMVGARRFLERVYGLFEKIRNDGGRGVAPHDVSEQVLSSEASLILHQTIKKVGEDIESFNFNTAISQLMMLVNALEKETPASSSAFEVLVRMLAPFAPHLADELWESLGHETSVHMEQWPRYDESVLARSCVTIVVQVNGKVRGSFSVERGADAKSLITMARALPRVSECMAGVEPAREVVVPDRLVNFVVDATQ